MKTTRWVPVSILIAVGVLTGCPNRSPTTEDAGPPDAGPLDAGPGDAGSVDAGPPFIPDGGFCSLPGSWIHDSGGWHVIGTDPAVAAHATLTYPGTWLTIPEGFCAHHFATVPDARQIRFAPGGELFVASPTMGTTGGGANGMAAIVVLPDDNQDGMADSVITFLGNLPATQGLLFANDSLYYQNLTQIMQLPYTTGQRMASGTAVVAMNFTGYESTVHWPKTLDISDNGTIYIGNGGDQGEACEWPMPFHGGILQADATTNPCTATNSSSTCGVDEIVRGLRNPIDVKCHRDGNNHCYATELALDYSASQGGREKLIPINPGENWGFPCCATQNLPYQNQCLICSAETSTEADSTSVCMAESTTSATYCSPNCSTIAADTNSFIIGNTPFGFDFDDTQFPTPWDHKVLVTLHGVNSGWSGARIVAILLDPTTGTPLPSSTIDGGVDTGNMLDFATGWDDGTLSHGRPADIEFARDGRMFVANDVSGEIFWVAPFTQ